MILLDAFVPGTPVPWARTTSHVTGNGKIRRNTPTRYRGWKGAAATLFGYTWKSSRPHEGPIRVDVLAVYKLPQRKPQLPIRTWRPHRPDIDNVGKAVLDALTDARLVRDDCQVVSLHLLSVYGAAGEAPGVHVRVSDSPGDPPVPGTTP